MKVELTKERGAQDLRYTVRQHFNCSVEVSLLLVLSGWASGKERGHRRSLCLGGSARRQRSTNLIAVQLISTGSFVLGAVSGAK